MTGEATALGTLRSALLAALAIAILAVPATSSMVEAADIEDHPLITRYPESVPSRRDEEEFRDYRLITGIAGADFGSIDVGGRFTRISYENPRDRSALEILENYRQAIAGAGGTVLFDCREDECGPTSGGNRWRRFNGTIPLPAVGGYVAGKVSSGDEIAYIAIGVARNRHQVTILEVREMETGLVEIDPDALGQELDRLGHVAIPGVFFATGSAELTPGSQVALDAMAMILARRPDLSVWIVGHTDWTGDFDLNARLSDARAKAVVAALTVQHGIAPGRLEGHGVGPLAPAASNAGEPGRTVNRRVEIVARP